MKTPINVQIAVVIFSILFGIAGICLLLLFIKTMHPIPLLLGLITCAGAWIPLFVGIRRMIIKRHMIKHGVLVTTIYQHVKRAPYDLFGWQPYIITTEWHDPVKNLIFHFKSPGLNRDPSYAMQKRMRIPVYIDPKNPKRRYYMDLRKVPQIADAAR